MHAKGSGLPGHLRKFRLRTQEGGPNGVKYPHPGQAEASLLKATGLPSILPQGTQEAENRHCDRQPQGCIPPAHISLDWTVNQKGSESLKISVAACPHGDHLSNGGPLQSDCATAPPSTPQRFTPALLLMSLSSWPCKALWLPTYQGFEESNSVSFFFLHPPFKAAYSTFWLQQFVF